MVATSGTPGWSVSANSTILEKHKVISKASRYKRVNVPANESTNLNSTYSLNHLGYAKVESDISTKVNKIKYSLVATTLFPPEKKLGVFAARSGL